MIQIPFLPSPKQLPSVSDSLTTEFYRKVKKVPSSQSNKPALRTMDGKHVLQWSLLKKMTSTTKSYYTSDPVLDSWFSILFSFATLHEGDQCKVASLSTLVSSIPTSNIQIISEFMLPAALNNLYCFNYWHLLDFVYFPLNIDLNHWILIRVGIQSKMIEVFDSLGNHLGKMIQDVSYY